MCCKVMNPFSIHYLTRTSHRLKQRLNYLSVWKWIWLPPVAPKVRVYWVFALKMIKVTLAYSYGVELVHGCDPWCIKLSLHVFSLLHCLLSSQCITEWEVYCDNSYMLFCHLFTAQLWNCEHIIYYVHPMQGRIQELARGGAQGRQVVGGTS